jgi:hypothetical protein
LGERFPPGQGTVALSSLHLLRSVTFRTTLGRAVVALKCAHLPCQSASTTDAEFFVIEESDFRVSFHLIGQLHGEQPVPAEIPHAGRVPYVNLKATPTLRLARDCHEMPLVRWSQNRLWNAFYPVVIQLRTGNRMAR